MRLLILGANGMFGHILWEEARKDGTDAYATLRTIPPDQERNFPHARIRLGVDVQNYGVVSRVLDELRPDVAINCIGIVKQAPAAKDAVTTVTVNSLFPHLLFRDCQERGIRLIHLSTDCVFSGKKGAYRESDWPDPVDFYGLSKWVGEPSGDGVLVIRTSMFGSEWGKRQGLLEWFLAQRGKTVRGFVKAVFSGFYTRSLARLVLEVSSRDPKVSGLRHLGAEPISKYTLLERIRDSCKLPIQIVPDESVQLDRSLDSGLFRSECHLQIPTWDSMIELLASDLRDEGRI